MHVNCLIVDDEQPLSVSTCEFFSHFGVTAHWAATADDCLAFLRQNSADLILLDINLGSSSGFTLCATLRATTDVPILFISARCSEDDMLLALNIGGDDYIQKPYSLSVLLAKVKAVLKRRQPSAPEALCFGNCRLDAVNGTLTRDGRPVMLTAMEFKLLCYLAKHSGRVVGKEELFANVWQDSITGDGTLNVHIRRLREKIEPDPNHPTYIKTSWKSGYRFDPQPQP